MSVLLESVESNGAEALRKGMASMAHNVRRRWWIRMSGNRKREG